MLIRLWVNSVITIIKTYILKPTMDYQYFVYYFIVINYITADILLIYLYYNLTFTIILL